MRLTALAPVAGGEVHGEARITGVTLDSRRVAPGDLYAALPGARFHGAQFAAGALADGAVAVLTDPIGAQQLPPGTAALVTEDPRAVLGAVAAAVFGYPSRGLTMLGTTGTNGKTTVSYLLDGALTAMGATTGLIGTVETKVAGERIRSVRTTPESPDLQRLLAQMVAAGVDVCSMEVSSHALSLHRVDAITYDVAGFTNLSQDHLDFHSTMADYFDAKAQLFTPARARRGVIMIDDEWGRRLVERAAAQGVPVTSVTTTGQPQPETVAAHWQVTAQAAEPDGTTPITVTGAGQRHALRTPLPGEFNIANTALAFAMLVDAGFDPEAVAAGMAQVTGVPGRMQRVLAVGDRWPDGQPLAIVDYAHSPDAVAKALQSLRSATPGTLVVVLGAGGDRDPGKRGAMGEVAATGADLVVVPADNPRSEDPAAIRAAVLAGAANGRAEVLEVSGRAAAIARAVAAVQGPLDTVLVAGKGHEQGQEIAGVIEPFDDAEVLAAALASGPGRSETVGGQA